MKVSRKTRGTIFLPWRGRWRGNGLAHEYAGSEPPRRAALLSADQMAQYGKTLAGSHKLGLEHAPDRLLTRLAENEGVLIGAGNLLTPRDLAILHHPPYVTRGPLEHARASRGAVEASFIRSMTMRFFHRFAICFIALLLASLLGCVSTPTRESTGEYIDDTVITTKVKVAVFNDPSLKSAEINVETFKGVVQLSGFVSSQADINKAVEVARSVQGVKSVKNNMLVKGQQ